jgi:hypothetical protein
MTYANLRRNLFLEQTTRYHPTIYKASRIPVPVKEMHCSVLLLEPGWVWEDFGSWNEVEPLRRRKYEKTPKIRGDTVPNLDSDASPSNYVLWLFQNHIKNQ